MLDPHPQGAGGHRVQGFTCAPPSSCARCRWVKTGETLVGNGWPSNEEFCEKIKEQSPQSWSSQVG